MWSTEILGGDACYVYKQQHGESCGPSSVLMLMRHVDGTLTAEAMVRLWFSQAEKAVLKSGGTAYGDKAGKDERIFDFSGGAGLNTIVQVLNTKRPGYNARHGGKVKDMSSKAPGIVRVQWPKAGGHFVVCIGKFDDGAGSGWRVFLDPWYGLVINRHDIYPLYDTATGSFGEGAALGRISHLITTAP